MKNSNFFNKDNKPPSWAVIGFAGLFGNIITTGSLGSGKTAGTILTYIQQIIRNFVIRPFILFIDPKNSFTQKMLKVLEQENLEEHIIHLKLGGDVTINPIFHKDLLKEARFIEYAQMLKAAAINFVGTSSDSRIWEALAFDLTKFGLVACAALNDYYTLNTLYQVLIDAKKDKLLKPLLEAYKNEKFNEEEKYNIKCAIKYFYDYKDYADKLKTSIHVTATNFLNQFQEYQASKIFCPKQEDITIHDIDELVDQGKFLFVDISNKGLARSMGTFIKLLCQKSVLNKISNNERDQARCSLFCIDEYQDVVTVGGGGGTLGDENFYAQGREAKSITIVATQSLSSLQNSISRKSAFDELIQNFRTRITCHSSDINTMMNFQKLAGKYDRERESQGLSESSQGTKINFIADEFESNKVNIQSSLNKSEQRENIIDEGDFSRLNTFEAFAQIFDGIGTTFHKLFLKPYFLDPRTPHSKVMTSIKVMLIMTALCFGPQKLQASILFPNICSVVKSFSFRSCLGLKVGKCYCPSPWPLPPRPCAAVSFNIPVSFIEVFPQGGKSYFTKLPGAAVQLTSVLKEKLIPYGADGGDDTHAFHAHTISIPFQNILRFVKCASPRMEKSCFDGMSEHLYDLWKTGSPDKFQPKYLAWSIVPKACLIKGAITSFTPPPELAFSHEGGCSFPMPFMRIYPPSPLPVCNGWGIFFPRSGVYNGVSKTVGSLMIAARMKSLSSEVFRSMPSHPFEKWQMINPQTSSCFRKGQNVAQLETYKRVNEIGRLRGKFSGYLYAIWKKVTCCVDYHNIPAIKIGLGLIESTCKTMGRI